jgi:hypothetical protein
MARTQEQLDQKERDTKKKKQARARARRAAKKGHRKGVMKSIAVAYKPLEEWDEEELARGRPRDANGQWRGADPAWVPRAVMEEAISRFTELAQGEMRALVPKALAMVEFILDNNEVDEKGRSLVPYATKLDAAKWTVEHLVGKPKQRMEADISVKLQGLLGAVLVQPGEMEMIGEGDGTAGGGGLHPAIESQSWELAREDDWEEDGPEGE